MPYRGRRRKLLARDERHASILRGAATAFARSGLRRHVDGRRRRRRSASPGSSSTGTSTSRRTSTGPSSSGSSTASARSSSPASSAARPRAVGAGTHLTVAREWPDGFVLLWRHAAREPQFADYADELREHAVEAARALLRQRRERRGDKVLDRWGAETIVGFIVEAVLCWLDDGDPERDDELLDLVTDAIIAMRTTWFP